eukprot:GAHX01002892.1.p1 GENE.GAHX01002892.1~~GAHX01002892.1.p1  ORF type:complete len:71 (+),score=9.96 GAHX01002892.1:52-264(+)
MSNNAMKPLKQLERRQNKRINILFQNEEISGLLVSFDKHLNLVIENFEPNPYEKKKMYLRGDSIKDISFN